MNFISQRPQHWVEIVGQDRAVKLLGCILRTERFMPRGYLFQGSVGVGKTTTAYILARALLCAGDDPMGCGTCSSCSFIDAAKDIERGLNLSSDFLEVDAASTSGVEHARGLMDIMNSPPSAMSARRVIIIDEAHQLSSEAWDVYLTPLETKDTSSVFIFVSNLAEDIKTSITSRLTPIIFERVPTEPIFGLLVNLANANKIAYEHDALQFIAKKSKGLVRDAVRNLGMVASMGTITLDIVKDALHDSLEDISLKCFGAIIRNLQVDAVKWIDEAGRNFTTSRVIESLFSIYARTPWAEPGTIYAQIADRLPNVSEVSAIFIKWLSNSNLPTDALPLVVYELINTLDTPYVSPTKKDSPSASSAVTPRGAIVKAKDIEKFFIS